MRAGGRCSARRPTACAAASSTRSRPICSRSRPTTALRPGTSWSAQAGTTVTAATRLSDRRLAAEREPPRGARRRRRLAALATQFRLGEDVVHAAFGDGVVTGVEPGGVIVVRFAGDGSERKLMAEYAPVSRR